MNIFYLDSCAQTCAQYHYDKHVVKMILESAQMLCTSLNEKVQGQITPYKSTHRNHPSTKWVGYSVHHAEWLYELFKYLNEEFKYRWGGDDHLSFIKLEEANVKDLLNSLLPDRGFSPPPLAMPEEYKMNDVVESYRLYYKVGKAHLFKYTRRTTPVWLFDDYT